MKRTQRVAHYARPIPGMDEEPVAVRADPARDRICVCIRPGNCAAGVVTWHKRHTTEEQGSSAHEHSSIAGSLSAHLSAEVAHGQAQHRELRGQHTQRRSTPRVPHRPRYCGGAGQAQSSWVFLPGSQCGTNLSPSSRSLRHGGLTSQHGRPAAIYLGARWAAVRARWRRTDPPQIDQRSLGERGACTRGGQRRSSPALKEVLPGTRSHPRPRAHTPTHSCAACPPPTCRRFRLLCSEIHQGLPVASARSSACILALRYANA